MPKTVEAAGKERTAMTADRTTLAKMAQKLRRHSLESTTAAGSGHPTTCMSCAEIVSVLFFQEMRFDPRRPDAADVDVFVLSKGHAAPILWAALKETGAIREDLLTLRRFDSPLEGHPTPQCPWVRVASGSLGQGLSAAAGMAQARKIDRAPGRIYCLLGDGETAEGSVWEAAAFAAHQGLDNLCAVVDVNRFGQSGPTMHEHDLRTYTRRFEAFGWNAIEVDGHSVDELTTAFATARQVQRRPTAILARTFKGHGVSFLENLDGWHGKPVPREKLTAAIAELGDTDVSIAVEPRSYPSSRTPDRSDPSPLVPAYKPGDSVATREAYGNALVALGDRDSRIVVVDGDVKNSTFAEKFKKAHPERYIEAFIAEQNMIGVALGASTEGKIPFASSFACFLTRAFDQIRMAAYSRPRHLVLCGSHSGLSIGEDGPSQMALEDLAMMRAIFGSTVLYPSDAVSAEKLTEAAARTGGIVYLRTTRPKTKVLYDAGESFPVGGSKTLRSSPKDRATIVAAGITLHEALAAHDLLAKEGIAVRVIDAYSVKPLDTETLLRAAGETGRIVTVEDHSVHGGLGEAVAAALPGIRVQILGVRDIPRSGKPEELMAWAGIDSAAIASEVRRAV